MRKEDESEADEGGMVVVEGGGGGEGAHSSSHISALKNVRITYQTFVSIILTKPTALS